MGKEVNIHATFGSRSKIIICKREEFLSRASKIFNIAEKNIKLYNFKTGAKILPIQLNSIMKVNIKTKHHKSSSRSEASTAEQSAQSDKILAQKLSDNRPLTASERQFLLKMITDPNFPSNKANPYGVTEKNKPSSLKKVQNVKIQVHPEKLIPVFSVETQTDKQDNVADKMDNEGQKMPPSSVTERSSAVVAMLQSKRLAAEKIVDSNEAQKLMDEMYDERRSFIMTQMPLVRFVKEKYPLLFSVTEVRHETERIFGQGKCENFSKNIEKYAVAILGIAKEEDPVLCLTNEKLQSFETDVQKKYALEVGSILLLSSILSENRTFLKLSDQSASMDAEYNLPYIETKAKFDELFSDDHLFKIYVEKILLCEASNFKEALLCLIGSFYIFNIKYPSANCNTFSVFEQLYLEEYDSNIKGEGNMVSQLIKCIRFQILSSETKSKRKKH